MAVLLGAGAPTLGADLTVSAQTPGPPGSGSYAVQISIPGFNPCLGTLNSLDCCIHTGFTKNEVVGTFYLHPSTAGVPITFSVSIGGGASLGRYDAAGFSAVCSAMAYQTITGTQPSSMPGPTIPVSANDSSCCHITSPGTLGAFTGTGPTSWYVGQDGRFIVNSVSPGPPNGSVLESFASSITSWGAVIDVTYHYTPRCVSDVDDGSGTGRPDCGVGIEDLLYYLSAYNSGAPAADVDDGTGTGTHDGGVGIEDLLYYLVHYNAGC